MRTTTGTYTKGGVTYNYSVTYPNVMAFIYSRHLYVKLAITDANDDPVVGRRIQVTMQPTFLSGYEYRYTDANGEVMVDVARMMQIVTDNVRAEFNLNYATAVALWGASARVVGLYDSGTQIALLSLEAYNGADDMGDCWLKTSADEPMRLRWFKNYPFTFDFPNVDEVTLKKDGGTQSVVSWAQQTSSLHYPMQRVSASEVTALDNTTGVAKLTASGWCYIDKDGTLQTNQAYRLNLEVCDCDYDTGKVYLRWLGKHGEIFYWLFNRHSEAEQVTHERSRRAMVPNWRDTYGLLDSESVDNYDAAKTLTVYSGKVDKHYYDILRSLVKSPIVDMLTSLDTITTPTWTRVVIDGGTYAETLKAPDIRDNTSRQLVFNIILPKEGGVTL